MRYQIPNIKHQSNRLTEDPIAGTYRCFGCGEKGNAIKFLMDYDQIPLSQAIDAYSHESGFKRRKLAEAAPALLNALRHWPNGSETPQQKQRGLQALQDAIEAALPAGETLGVPYTDADNEPLF